MRKYTICCESLDKPDDWVYLGSSNHAVEYASRIYRNEDLCTQLFFQYEDFKRMYCSLISKTKADLDKKAFFAFQVQFQSECLQRINYIRKKANLSRFSYPFAFVP